MSFVAGLAVVLVHHVAVFHPSWRDENVHLYVAGRLAAGLTLYGDVHSARPPLALAPTALLLRAGLSPLLAARATVVLAVAATALVLLVAGLRERNPGRRSALRGGRAGRHGPGGPIPRLTRFAVAELGDELLPSPARWS